MSYPLLASVAPGDQYLVDLGDLVPVAAVSARSAYRIAMTALYGPVMQYPPEQPLVYQFDANGELIAVFD